MAQRDKPVKRNNVGPDIFLFLAFHIGFVVAARWLSEDKVFLLSLSAILVLIELTVVRGFLLARELLFWRNTYTSLTELFLRIVKMEQWQSFLVSYCINSAIILIYWSKSQQEFKEMLAGKHYSLIDFVLCHLPTITVLYFQWADCPLTDSYRLEKSFTLSGGSCMALGYFYGYLKIILPQFLDRLNNFQNSQGIDERKIPEKKLFILIPSSTFIFDKLRQTGKEMIEPLEEKLDPLKQNRGLIINRVYKNTVYKIKDINNKNVTKYYVPLEGATPLKTFEETCSQEPHFKAFKREVLSAFYYTLETLISRDRNVNGLAELIYYDDEKEPDIEVADVVRERMKYLRHTARKKKV